MGDPSSRGTVPAQAMPYLPGLDGLRALAIAGVLLYHADVEWLPGGFLGVEVFFVVSGFLITQLLLAEHRSSGTVDLRGFWVRRFRRLVPALVAYLVGSLGLALLFAPDVVDEWRQGALAALAYVANWFGVFNDVSYAEGFGRKSFLHHLWSLGIEEQFYLVWPLVLLVLLRLVGRWATWIVVLGGIVGSTALLWWLYEPLSDPTRVYYGTDTRASGLLVGAALAFVWRPWIWPVRERRVLGALVGGSTAALGAAGLVGVCWAMWRYDIVLPNADPTFRWGLLVTAGCSAAAIAGMTVPGNPLTRVAAVRPLRWIGTRSYGIYLWHWPIFLVTRERIDVDLEGPALLVVRLALTAVAAELSYQLVEQPMRRGSVRSAFGAVLGDRRARLGAAQLLVAGTMAVGILHLAQSPQTTDEPAVVALPPAPTASPAPTATPSPEPTPTPTSTVSATEPAATEARTEATATPTAQPTVTPTPSLDPVSFERVTLVGDSVMEGAAIELDELVPGAHIDTLVGRHWFQAGDVIDALAEDDEIGDAVVLHLGNNGPINDELFDEVLARLTDVELVVIINVRVPVRWEGPVNDELAAGVERWGNTVLVDWHERSDDRPAFFASDGVHLTDRGRRSYSRAVARALGIDPNPPPPPQIVVPTPTVVPPQPEPSPTPAAEQGGPAPPPSAPSTPTPAEG